MNDTINVVSGCGDVSRIVNLHTAAVHDIIICIHTQTQMYSTRVCTHANAPPSTAYRIMLEVRVTMVSRHTATVNCQRSTQLLLRAL